VLYRLGSLLRATEHGAATGVHSGSVHGEGSGISQSGGTSSVQQAVPKPNTFFPRAGSHTTVLMTALAHSVRHELLLHGCVSPLNTATCPSPSGPSLF
jgi:hypothetical protein